MDSGEIKSAPSHTSNPWVQLSGPGEGKDHQDDAALSRANAPVYWQHRRHESYASLGHSKPPPIILEDNTEDAPNLKSPLWAREVTIDGYTIVSGGVPGVGDYTSWSCRINTLDVSESGTCWTHERGIPV